MGVESKIANQKGNKLQVKFELSHSHTNKDVSFTSAKYFCGATYFQVKIESSRAHAYNENSLDINVYVHVKFSKMLKDDSLKYIGNVSSIEFAVNDFKLSDEEVWYELHSFKILDQELDEFYSSSFDLSATIDIAPCVGPFSSLHDDTELVDFELRSGEDIVQVHKTVLAASSPVFKAMFGAKWKEGKEAHVQVANANKDVLETFKDYIYLQTLPDKETELQNLLLLGSFYMMPELVQKCSVKLLNKLSEDNIVDLLEFAAKFRVSNLLLVVLKFIQTKVVDINNISFLNWNVVCEETKATLE